MSLAILSSYLAFNIPATRRDVAIGGAAAAVASAFPIPASAGLMFDPIGAYSMGGSSGATNLKPVKADPLRPNSGITLLREVFDGYLPDGGLLKWYEQHLADDFQAVFEGGKVKLDKQAWAASASPPLAVHLSPSIHACCSSASLCRLGVPRRDGRPTQVLPGLHVHPQRPDRVRRQPKHRRLDRRRQGKTDRPTDRREAAVGHTPGPFVSTSRTGGDGSVASRSLL